jgi:hypothetical protein
VFVVVATAVTRAGEGEEAGNDDDDDNDDDEEVVEVRVKAAVGVEGDEECFFCFGEVAALR